MLLGISRVIPISPEKSRANRVSPERFGVMLCGVGLNRPKADETSLRLEVSLRLKAARYLAGGLRPTKKGELIASPVTVDELAADPVIVKNGISKNRLDAYEQMKTEPRPMELRVIAEALGVDPEFLLEPLAEKPEPQAVEDTLAVLQDTLKTLQDQLPRLGRDIGKRDLEWHPTRGHQDSTREDAA